MGSSLSSGLVLVHWQAILLGLFALLLLCLLSQHVRDVLLIIVLEALGRGAGDPHQHSLIPREAQLLHALEGAQWAPAGHKGEDAAGQHSRQQVRQDVDVRHVVAALENSQGPNDARGVECSASPLAACFGECDQPGAAACQTVRRQLGFGAGALKLTDMRREADWLRCFLNKL